MNTAINIQRRKEAKINHLRVVHRRKTIEKQKLANATMHIALSALWNCDEFSAKEKQLFKRLIIKHYDPSQTNEQNFIDLSERICLVKRHLMRNPNAYVVKPSDWFHINYSHGLSGTKSWLEKVKEQRKTVSTYHNGIRTFANGVLAYLENPSTQTFIKFRKALIEQKQFTLLDIFYKTIINLLNHK